MTRLEYIPILTALTLLIGVSACQKEGVEPGAAESYELMTFAPTLDGAGTRGSMITGTDFGDRTFKAACWTDDNASGSYTKQFDYTKVKKITHSTGSKHAYWSTVDETKSDTILEKFWKGTGTAKTKVNKKFYAYANLPSTSGAATVATAGSANQTLTYDISKVPTAASQTDILLGYYSGNGVKPTHGTTHTDYVGWAAPINFRHPLSAIRIKKGTVEGWTGTDKITEISIAGVYASGTCTDNGTFSWGSTAGSATVSMSATGGLAIGADSIIGETFFLIPQTFTASAITISVNLTVDGTSYSPSATLSADEWKAGNYYTYTLNYTAGYPTVLSVKLANWGEIKTDAQMEDGSVLGFENPGVDAWDNGISDNLNYTD